MSPVTKGQLLSWNLEVFHNYLVGNHDAHGKNFSIIYGRQTRLAPMYDVVSTAFYPELSTKMAMKLGGEYASGRITAKHFDAFAEDAGLGKPMVRSRLRELAKAGLLAQHDILAHCRSAS